MGTGGWGVVVVAAAPNAFFFGSCSSAALLSLPPVQAASVMSIDAAMPILQRTFIRGLESNRCAAKSSIRRNAAVQRPRPLGVTPEALQRRLAAVSLDELFVVLVGDAGDGVKRCDQLLGTQAAPEERVGEEDVAAVHAESTEEDFRVEAEELLHQIERRLHALHAEREDFDDGVVFLVRLDRDLENRRSVLEIKVAVLRVVEVLVHQLVEILLHLPVDFLLALRM